MRIEIASDAAYAEKEWVQVTTVAATTSPAMMEGVASSVFAVNRTTVAIRPRPYSER
jgi:hypothetical protein